MQIRRSNFGEEDATSGEFLKLYRQWIIIQRQIIDYRCANMEERRGETSGRMPLIMSTPGEINLFVHRRQLFLTALLCK